MRYGIIRQEITADKISRRPIVTRFSVTEFKYKLDKIKQDYGKLHDKKNLGLINHIIKQASEFSPKTNEKNIYIVNYYSTTFLRNIQ